MLSTHGLALIIALVLNAAANLLMKAGMTKVQSVGGLFSDGAVGAVRHVLFSPVLLTGLCCFGLNACFYMFALQSKALKISLAYPVMIGGGYAIIVTIGYLVLGERLTSLQKIGVALILVGVVIVASRSDPVVVA